MSLGIDQSSEGGEGGSGLQSYFAAGNCGSHKEASMNVLKASMRSSGFLTCFFGLLDGLFEGLVVGLLDGLLDRPFDGAP